jgi:hypothetical protein
MAAYALSKPPRRAPQAGAMADGHASQRVLTALGAATAG